MAGLSVPRPRTRRLAQLLAGLVAYGVSDALMVLGGLGLDPWDVLHQGLARHTGIPIGTWAIIVGAAVLLLWIPLRQRPGAGTVLNIAIIGLVIDVVLAVVPAPRPLPLRWVALLSGVALNGVATAAYIGAGLGPGPRDGLMTGIAARGRSLRLVRTGIELTVLAAGWLLGGTVGIGTVLYAVGIGPIVHLLLPRVAVQPRLAAPSRTVGRRVDEPFPSEITSLRRAEPGAVPGGRSIRCPQACSRSGRKSSAGRRSCS